jgi:acylphosphatase
MTTRRIARAHPVRGYVRNLPDGRVEVVAEGEPEAIAGFIGAIRREFEGDIVRLDETPVPPHEPPAEGFEIRF